MAQEQKGKDRKSNFMSLKWQKNSEHNHSMFCLLNKSTRLYYTLFFVINIFRVTDFDPIIWGKTGGMVVDKNEKT